MDFDPTIFEWPFHGEACVRELMEGNWACLLMYGGVLRLGGIFELPIMLLKHLWNNVVSATEILTISQQ